MTEVAPTLPVAPAPTEAPAAAAPVVSSDDAALAIMAEAMSAGGETFGEPKPVEAPAAPAEPVPVEAAPVVDPIEALEQRRTEYLAQQATDTAAREAGEQKSASQLAHEQGVSALADDRALLESDPYAFLDKHGINKQAVLGRLVKAGTDPQAHKARTGQQSEVAELKEQLKELSEQIKTQGQESAQRRQNADRASEENEYHAHVTAHATEFPLSAKATPAMRLAIAHEVADRYRGVISRDSDPLGLITRTVEHTLQERVKEYATLAGQAPAATTEADTSGSGTPTQGQTPAPVTITNELAGQPPGTVPPPATDEDREAKALKDFQAELYG